MAKKKDELNELTDLLKRTQADFINYKNRVEKEHRDIVEYSNADFVKELLPVLDSFELALSSKSDYTEFKKGMEMIYSQLYDLLKQKGLAPIETQGRFDPYRHEVMLKEKSEADEDSILEVFQKGYRFKDRVIRHAKVKIAGR